MRKWQPTPAFLPGKFHRQSLASYSSWDHKELGAAERLSIGSLYATPHGCRGSPASSIDAATLSPAVHLSVTRALSLGGFSPASLRARNMKTNPFLESTPVANLYINPLMGLILFLNHLTRSLMKKTPGAISCLPLGLPDGRLLFPSMCGSNGRFPPPT